MKYLLIGVMFFVCVGLCIGSIGQYSTVNTHIASFTKVQTTVVSKMKKITDSCKTVINTVGTIASFFDDIFGGGSDPIYSGDPPQGGNIPGLPPVL